MSWEFEQVAGPYGFAEGTGVGWGSLAVYGYFDQPRDAL